MTDVTIQNRSSGERGNVLFLILIAVALFAALSYAVTQSTRSGSGDASGETNLINSAQLAQYPAGVRTAIVRMIIGGINVEQLAFNPPATFGVLAASDFQQAVFHPQGGGAVFQAAPNDVMANGSPGTWIFTSDYQVSQIGLDDTGTPLGNDVMAMLPGVGQNICRRINQELGITTAGADGDGVPNAGGTTVVPAAGNSMILPGHAGIQTNEVAVIAGAFVGQPFGCYDSNDGNADVLAAPLVYYHVLVER